MDRFDAMVTLLAAVDGGSLSAASRALGMPLPTVSRKVSELEDHLHTQLVVRTSRRLVLTEAGRAFVEASRRILDQLNEAERQAAGEYRVPQGNLTVTAPIVFGRLYLEPVVLAFLKAYPDVDVRLMLADGQLDLVEGHIDVALRFGQLPDSTLMATRLGSIRWVTCASPAYLAQRGVPDEPADLTRHDCVRFDGVYGSRAWTFRDGKAQVEVAVRPRLSVNTAEAAIDAAVASTGITRVLSYQVARLVHEGALALVLRAFESEPVPVHMLYAQQPLLPLKLRAFLDFAAPRVKATLERLAL